MAPSTSKNTPADRDDLTKPAGKRQRFREMINFVEITEESILPNCEAFVISRCVTPDREIRGIQ